MEKKTHKTAAVIIPPSGLWEPTQKIRKRYDRHFDRWMPHINLLYPFILPEKFQDAAVWIKKELHGFEPFELSLDGISYFSHRKDAFTFWLEPRPESGIMELYEKLLRLFPLCDDTARHDRGYVPHLTLGQNYDNEESAKKLVSRLNLEWKNLSWTVDRVHLIWRGALPDDKFRIGEEIRF